jgi:hypothetical protein
MLRSFDELSAQVQHVPHLYEQGFDNALEFETVIESLAWTKLVQGASFRAANSSSGTLQKSDQGSINESDYLRETKFRTFANAVREAKSLLLDDH